MIPWGVFSPGAGEMGGLTDLAVWLAGQEFLLSEARFNAAMAAQAIADNWEGQSAETWISRAEQLNPQISGVETAMRPAAEAMMAYAEAVESIATRARKLRDDLPWTYPWIPNTNLTDQEKEDRATALSGLRNLADERAEADTALVKSLERVMPVSWNADTAILMRSMPVHCFTGEEGLEAFISWAESIQKNPGAADAFRLAWSYLPNEQAEELIELAGVDSDEGRRVAHAISPLREETILFDDPVLGPLARAVALARVGPLPFGIQLFPDSRSQVQTEWEALTSAQQDRAARMYPWLLCGVEGIGQTQRAVAEKTVRNIKSGTSWLSSPDARFLRDFFNINIYESDLEDRLHEKLGPILRAAGFPEEDLEVGIRQIANEMWNAPEPWRSIYLEHFEEVIYSNDPKDIARWDGTTLFDYFWKDYKYHKGDTWGTLYHELGHAVDDHESDDGSKTDSYSINGQTLNDALRSDVASYLDRRITKEMGESPHSNEIRDAIMSGDLKPLSVDDRRVADRVIFGAELEIRIRDGWELMEIFGAYTGDLIGGQGTDIPASQFWADYASAQLNQNYRLGPMLEFFPSGSIFSDRMAQSMAQS